MALRLFAALAVGSYELSLKVYEIRDKSVPKILERLRYGLEIGRDSYFTGKVGMKNVDEICRVLHDYLRVIESYKISEFAAVGTSAVRATSNTQIFLDQIRNRTGIDIMVLPNSEQRFFEYKSLSMIKNVRSYFTCGKSLITEISGSSIQMSVFSPDERGDYSLDNTYNAKLGLVRLRELMYRYTESSKLSVGLLDRLISEALEQYQRVYDGLTKADNLIVLDSYMTLAAPKMESMFAKNKAGTGIASEEEGSAYKVIDAKSFLNSCELLRQKSLQEIVSRMGVSENRALMLQIAARLIFSLASAFEVKRLIFPGTDLLDGLAIDYAVRHCGLKPDHNFESDVIRNVGQLSRHFKGDSLKSQRLAEMAKIFFDGLKKVHGMTAHDKVLLELAAMMHDCGHYIGWGNVGENAYTIITGNEITGINPTERLDIANAVKYCYTALSQNELDESGISLRAEKFCAILRVALGLVRTGETPYKKCKAAYKDGVLTLSVVSNEDLSLEAGIFEEEKACLRRVFGVEPQLKIKKDSIL